MKKSNNKKCKIVNAFVLGPSCVPLLSFPPFTKLMSTSMSQIFVNALVAPFPDTDYASLLELEFQRFQHDGELGEFQELVDTISPPSIEQYRTLVLYFQEERQNSSPFDFNQTLFKNVTDGKRLHVAILLRLGSTQAILHHLSLSYFLFLHINIFLGADINARERENRSFPLSDIFCAVMLLLFF